MSDRDIEELESAFKIYRRGMYAVVAIIFTAICIVGGNVVFIDNVQASVELECAAGKTVVNTKLGDLKLHIAELCGTENPIVSICGDRVVFDMSYKGIDNELTSAFRTCLF